MFIWCFEMDNMEDIAFSVFFWLPLDEKILMEILSSAGFNLISMDETGFKIFPGLIVQPGPRPIASYEGVKISWDAPKRNLIFHGSSDQVVVVVEKTFDLFERFSYDVNRLINFVEIVVPKFRVSRGNVVNKIREKINWAIDLDIESGKYTLKAYSISFTTQQGPIGDEDFYDWFKVSIEPDNNSPDKAFYVSLIKRFKHLKDSLMFIRRIEKTIDSIISKIFA